MAVKIIGANCSLGEAVIDKLLIMDVDVISEDNSHFSRNKRLLEFSNVSMVEKGEGFSMSFDGSNADIVIGRDVIISDLIPSRADKWMPEEIKAWLEHKETDVRERYWLSVVDAANALAIIAKSGKKVSNIHMCGRRKWLSKDTKAEFEMLYERTLQGKSGKFTAETLFGHEISGMEAVMITGDEIPRPDLQPLQDLLVDLTGEGWRPLVPFRTALMTLLAGVLE